MEAAEREKIVFCDCGCGKSFYMYDNRGRIRHYISGHNGRGEKVQRIRLACDFCGMEIIRLSCQIKKGNYHFCNRHCKSKWIGQNTLQTPEYKEKKRRIALKNGNIPPPMRGEDHPNWKGGISKQDRRSDARYKKWYKEVLAKDNFTCQICGLRGGRLSAHHIRAWADFPELRYDINNGQCLCYDCHMELHGLKKKIA
jgi:hypothetical protein